MEHTVRLGVWHGMEGRRIPCRHISFIIFEWIAGPMVKKTSTMVGAEGTLLYERTVAVQVRGFHRYVFVVCCRTE